MAIDRFAVATTTTTTTTTTTMSQCHSVKVSKCQSVKVRVSCSHLSNGFQREIVKRVGFMKVIEVDIKVRNVLYMKY